MSRVAAIDCGTNSIRMLVADVTRRDDGSAWLRDVYRQMRVVRLGQGVDATGMLASEAIARTRDALREYAAMAVRKGVESARMVATSATRDARNREDFFAMTREVLGVEAEVITGEEEARLSFVGAVGDVEPEGGPYLVTDIGGGSTELVLGRWDGVAATIEGASSVDVGSVRLTERCLPSDPPTAGEIAAAEKFAAETLAGAFKTLPIERARRWIGVAGTVTTMSAVRQGLAEYDPERTHGSTLSLADVREVTGRLLSLSRAERARIGSIHPGRIDVIGGGVLVVRVLAEQLAERTGISELRVSEQDILDGIALSLL